MKEKSKKILLLSTSFWPLAGGSETAIREVAARLPDYRFDLVTARLNRHSPSVEQKGNAQIFRVGNGLNFFKFLLPKNFLPLAMFKLARKLLKNSRYDLMHVWQASQAGGAAWLLKKTGWNNPLLLTLQEGEDLSKQNWLTKYFRKLIIKNADQATAISQYLVNYLKKTKKNLPVKLIPNGVDLEKFAREFSYGELSNLADELGLRPGAKVIISTSRLVAKNGLDSLIKSLAVLQKKYPQENWRLLLVGDGPLKESLKLLVESLKLEKQVIFKGGVEHGELPGYLKISHVFARPSRSEGLGVSFLEAMAAGLPIIGSAVGGIPDFLTDKETGLFCDPCQPEDIAEKIKLILDDDNLRKNIIKKARALVEEKYDWNKIAEEYRKLYETVQTN